MLTRYRTFLALCAVSLSSAGPSIAEPTAYKVLVDRRATLDAFLRDNASVRYRYGECNRSLMDCSCFVQRLFADRFGTPIPRSTLTQTNALHRYKVESIARPTQLDDSRLCVGDLIYTYRNSWSEGPRHVVVYAGDDWVIHSSSNLGGIGSSNLAWVQQYNLYGVYRPLDCEGSPRRRAPVLSSPAPKKPSAVDAESAPVRAVIDALFRAWQTRDLELYRRSWSTDAVQWSRGTKLGYRELMAKRREDFRDLRQVRQEHRFEAVSVWGDYALVEVVYDLDLTFRSRKPIQERDKHESYVLRRQDGSWRITHNETYQGE